MRQSIMDKFSDTCKYKGGLIPMFFKIYKLYLMMRTEALYRQLTISNSHYLRIDNQEIN